MSNFYRFPKVEMHLIIAFGRRTFNFKACAKSCYAAILKLDEYLLLWLALSISESRAVTQESLIDEDCNRTCLLAATSHEVHMCAVFNNTLYNSQELDFPCVLTIC